MNPSIKLFPCTTYGTGIFLSSRSQVWYIQAMPEASYHARLRDEVILHSYSERDPILVTPLKPIGFDTETLAKIGILDTPQKAGLGHIKYAFEDFIVEEITETNNLCSVSTSSYATPDGFNPEAHRVEATIVKKGLNGFELSERLAEALNIPLKYITYGGLKDGRGVTAQRYCFNQVSPEQIANVRVPNTFIKEIHPRIGMRATGELRGNRFTLVVRTKDINPYFLHGRIQAIEREGFPNFFSIQRFGTRMIAHELGEEILKGNYEGAVRQFMLETSDHETPLLNQYRQSAAKVWGDWAAMIQVFSPLPYFFQNEIAALHSLSRLPNDFGAALAAIPDQTKMWVSAFGSYCFNVLLSNKVQHGGDIPPRLPLISSDSESLASYAILLGDERCQALRWHHPKLPFLLAGKKREIPSYIKPRIELVTNEGPIWFLRFELGKGAYATTFLSNIFELTQGRHFPDWVSADTIDSTLLFDGFSIQDTLNSLTPNTSEESVDSALE